MKKIICIAMCALLLSSCHIYRKYERPQELPVDSLFRGAESYTTDDSLTLGDLPWEEIFQDTLLQNLIRFGLDNNTDLQTALLRVDQAKAQLTAARLNMVSDSFTHCQSVITLYNALGGGSN